MANHARSQWLGAALAAALALATAEADQTASRSPQTDNANRPAVQQNQSSTPLYAGRGQSAATGFGIGQRPAASRVPEARPPARQASAPGPNAPAPELRRLPPVWPPATQTAASGATGAAPGALADGTWLEDDRHIIINLNGQQLTLVKTGPQRSATTQQSGPRGGKVYGRLSHRGRPLVNCRVALIRLTKTWNGYDVDGSAEPQTVTTDDRGVYYFDNVPPGLYKLSWLPEGSRQWIRRIAFRPDVRVRADQTSHVKEISASLRTIN